MEKKDLIMQQMGEFRKWNKGFSIQKRVFELLDGCDNISAKEIWNRYENSRFCKPSLIWIKDIVKIENRIIEQDSDYDFIRVSELVPMWLYNFLSGMSPKRSVQTNRWLELCSDLSVSLALEGLFQRKKNLKKYIKLAWFDTTFRPQNFKGANNQFKVPHAHFSIYGNAIVGQEKKEYFFVKKFLPDLLRHYLKILTSTEDFLLVNDLEISLASMLHTHQLLDRLGTDLHTLRDFQLKTRAETWKEPTINDVFDTDIVLRHDTLESLYRENDKGLDLSLGYLSSIFQEVRCLENEFPVKVTLQLWRTWGAGQYSSLAFSIFWTNKDGKRMDIADGGVTDWWKKMLNSNERCLVWWLWIDLLAKFYQQ